MFIPILQNSFIDKILIVLYAYHISITDVKNKNLILKQEVSLL